jgi:hypothetical protein
VDTGNADVFQEFSAASTTDYHQGSVRVLCETLQNFTRGGHKAHLVRARRDGDQRTVEIQENGDTAVLANFLSDAIPIFQQVWGFAD